MARFAQSDEVPVPPFALRKTISRPGSFSSLLGASGDFSSLTPLNKRARLSSSVGIACDDLIRYSVAPLQASLFSVGDGSLERAIRGVYCAELLRSFRMNPQLESDIRIQKHKVRPSSRQQGGRNEVASRTLNCCPRRFTGNFGWADSTTTRIVSTTRKPRDRRLKAVASSTPARACEIVWGVRSS